MSASSIGSSNAPAINASRYNSSMFPVPDVLVLGGGVIGLTAAYFLARAGVRVEVVDKGDLGQEASWAGAGILPPGNPERAETPYDLLRAHSAALYPGLSAELLQKTGIDNGYLRCGGLEFVEHHEPALEEMWQSEGISFKRLSADDALQLESALAPDCGQSYHVPDMAQLRNPRHLRALIAGCHQLGVRLRPGCPVHGFDIQGSQVRAVRTLEGSLPAGRFLVATGAWTDLLLGPLDCQVGIRPIRGQIALLHTDGPVIRRILLSGKRYLVPRADGRLLIGATEEEVGFEKRSTAGAIAELLTFAQEMVTCLAHATIERCWSGLRPASTDGFPMIGLMPGYENLLIAAGHFRAGIQLSPATALSITELVLGRPLTVPLDAFRPERSPSPPARLAFRS